MKVRIKLDQGPPFQHREGKNRQLALGFGGLLVPAAVMAYALGFWRLASDMKVAGPFGLSGLFSHWQVWLALAALLHIVASILTRYGLGGELQWPRILSPRILSFRK